MAISHAVLSMVQWRLGSVLTYGVPSRLMSERSGSSDHDMYKMWINGTRFVNRAKRVPAPSSPYPRNVSVVTGFRRKHESVTVKKSAKANVARSRGSCKNAFSYCNSYFVMQHYSLHPPKVSSAFLPPQSGSYTWILLL